MHRRYLLCKGRRYITVVYDMDRHCTVWVHEGHGQRVFENFCSQLTEEQRAIIKVVAGDDDRWIDPGMQRLPNAVRCVDPFHVVCWVEDAIDELRTPTAREAKSTHKEIEQKFIAMSTEALEKAAEELMEAESGGDEDRQKTLRRYISVLERFKDCDDRKSHINNSILISLFSPEKQEILRTLEKLSKDLQKARYAVGKNSEQKTAHAEDTLQMIQENTPELSAPYRLKEELTPILLIRDAEEAAGKLDLWIEKARNLGLAPFAELSDKIVQHRQHIHNAITYQANLDFYRIRG